VTLFAGLLPGLRLAGAGLALCVATATLGAPMRLDVDATDAPRRLIHATLTIPATSGETVIRYVEWTPGNHNPSGPIQNVVSFKAETESGQILPWRRDPTSDTRITIMDVPDWDKHVIIRLTYIASQPTTNSRSTDSYGEPTLGGISWNTVLFYPEDADKDELLIDTTITIPEGWSMATSLRAARQSNNQFEYDDVSLAELVDSPAIFGEHLASITLSTDAIPNHYMHGVARDLAQLFLPDARIEKLKRVHEQAELVFGSFPSDRYDYLVFVSDEVPGFGLEHHTCTFISMGDRAWADCEKAGGSKMGVMPHEYIHAWNGKLRAPEGLLTRNFHEAGVTDLLWVYEGLTSYMDDVLLVRSGLYTHDEYVDTITNNIMRYQMQIGRQWRPVVDTARGMKRLRDRSKSWEELRRRQDYYGEAALFWMEADATIRANTDNRKSLDDFCLLFFDAERGPMGSPVTYTRDDVVEALTTIDPSTDWDTTIARRIESPAQTLALDLPTMLGRQLEFTDEPTELQKKALKKNKGLDLRTTLGFAVNKDGVVTTLLLGSIADQAKLAYDMEIVGVNDQEFSTEALKDAVNDSTVTGEVRLLVKFGGRLFSRPLQYDGGLRYPRLVPIEGETDYITEIARAR
jgi:predicted metalloprotease with PDZ domain